MNIYIYAVFLRNLHLLQVQHRGQLWQLREACAADKLRHRRTRQGRNRETGRYSGESFWFEQCVLFSVQQKNAVWRFVLAFVFCWYKFSAAIKLVQWGPQKLSQADQCIPELGCLSIFKSLVLSEGRGCHPHGRRVNLETLVEGGKSCCEKLIYKGRLYFTIIITLRDHHHCILVWSPLLSPCVIIIIITNDYWSSSLFSPCVITIITTLCDHVPRLPGEVISNTESWISFESDHNSVAAFSNFEAGKKMLISFVQKISFLWLLIVHLGGSSRKAINWGGMGESLTRDWM